MELSTVDIENGKAVKIWLPVPASNDSYVEGIGSCLDEAYDCALGKLDELEQAIKYIRENFKKKTEWR